MDARQLEKEIEKLRVNAQSQRQQAERYRQNAEGVKSRGDDVTARIDEQKADAAMKEAERMERDADKANDRLQDNLREANGIKQKEAELESNFKREMDQLERRKRQLLGESSLLF